MRPQRVRIIGIISGCVTLKNPSNRCVDDPMPLSGAHCREHGIVMDTGIVDQDLDRACAEHPIQCLPARCPASVTSKLTAPSGRRRRRSRGPGLPQPSMLRCAWT